MTQEQPKLHLYKVSPSTSEGGVEPDFIGPARCGGMITKLSSLTRFGIPAMGAFELPFDSKLSSLTRFGIRVPLSCHLTVVIPSLQYGLVAQCVEAYFVLNSRSFVLNHSQNKKLKIKLIKLKLQVRQILSKEVQRADVDSSFQHPHIKSECVLRYC